MKYGFRKLALAGVMAAAFATPALAAVSASATVSDFSITLYDLNPLDGIMPTITWSSISADPNMATNTSASVSGPYSASNTYNYTPIGVLNTSTATISDATATATINGNMLSASGSATATSASWQNRSFSAGARHGDYVSNFILSANTAAIFTANVTTLASVTVGYDPLSGQSEAASANITMSVSGNGASGNGSQNSSDSLSASAGGWWWYPTLPLTQSNSAILAGSFVNTSAGDLSGAFQLGATVNGYTNVVASAVSVTAVPEPESYAMFLAGLGLIGAVARRRQAR
ncbi:MAG: hypothetical protein H6R14_678 [Proteobacteria bacterium]|nr:hypothetical protein [Pseudomonadota bacterium]